MVEELHFTNALQSTSERQAKYQLARALSCSHTQSYRMRDWPWHKIAMYFGYNSWEELYEEKSHVIARLPDWRWPDVASPN